MVVLDVTAKNVEIRQKISKHEIQLDSFIPREKTKNKLSDLNQKFIDETLESLFYADFKLGLFFTFLQNIVLEETKNVEKKAKNVRFSNSSL